MVEMAVRPAFSPQVSAKAERLADTVEYLGRGMFAVRGDQDRYVVKAPYGERDPEQWTCDCNWGRFGGANNTRGTMCSHVRAADIWLARVNQRR